MRRMYSEQELTKIINEVLGQKIESGEFDQVVSDSVDAYLVEHPVDITALEGKTIAPANVNATNNITAKTIRQTEANETYNITFGSEPGLVKTNIYSKLLVIGNVLFVVGNVKIENTTENPISTTLSTNAIALSNTTASKIYDVSGLALSETGTIFTRVCDFMATMNDVAQVGAGSVVSKIFTIMRTTTGSAITIRAMSGESFSIPANSTRYISFRTFLTLL